MMSENVAKLGKLVTPLRQNTPAHSITTGIPQTPSRINYDEME